MFDLTTRNESDNSASPVILKPLARVPCRPHIVAKKKPRQSYRKQRTKKARTDNFRAAVLFAYAMDWPVNVSITVTWSALIEAGEHNEGHCLGKSTSERDTHPARVEPGGAGSDAAGLVRTTKCPKSTPTHRRQRCPPARRASGLRGAYAAQSVSASAK